MQNSVRILIQIIFSLMVFTTSAQALPIGHAIANDEVSFVDTTYDFSGIVRLKGCSGSLVRFEHSLDTDKALVLTNGHCVKLINPGEIIYNQVTTKKFTILASDASDLGEVRAEKLLYATMTKTDVALYRLEKTYQQIRQLFATEALLLSPNVPELHEDVEVISGYWRRGYSCQLEAEIPEMVEGDWHWESSLRYSRPGCEVIGGTSGSPVVLFGTRTVVAINNTVNESGENCTINNPCEVDVNGNVSSNLGFSYAQQTYWIYSCLADDRSIDLNTQGCMLFQ